MSDNYQRIIDALATCKRVLVTTHVRPDGDAIGTSAALVLALQKRGIDAEVLLLSHLPRKYAFVFEENAPHCMWMKNTLLPLSVAFIDEAGAIINLADMQPKSEQTHCAAKPARFALEMNKGWFAQRGIKAGAKIRGLEKLKPR